MNSVVGNIPQETTEKSASENPLLSRETLRRIHSYMVECRKRYGRNGNGTEAIEVPILAHLRPGDTIATAGKHWMTATLQTSPLARMMGELFPEQGDRSAPNVVSEVTTAVSHVGVGAGLAIAYKMQGLSNIAVLLGDRGMLESSTTEVLSLAGEKKLPVIFVIESKTDSSLSPAMARKLEDQMNVKALQYGFPAIPVDGHDAIAVYRVAQEAITRARKGGGPTLIECKIQNGTLDPIAHIEAYMQKRGL